jgi:methylsterol monooxygenase
MEAALHLYSSLFHVTILPSLACMTTFFSSCFFFDWFASDPSRRKRFSIQTVTETPEFIREMKQTATQRLFVGFLVVAILHPISTFVISTAKFDLRRELSSLLALFLLADANFYWSHRLLHHHWFYSWCHKHHHSCKHPTPWTSLYVAWGEFVIAILSSFLLPPWLVRLCLGWEIHYFTYSIYLVVLTFSLVMSHDGLELPFLSATHHDNHHLFFTGNYGTKFGLWDWIMGTIYNPSSIPS